MHAFCELKRFIRDFRKDFWSHLGPKKKKAFMKLWACWFSLLVLSAIIMFSLRAEMCQVSNLFRWTHINNQWTIPRLCRVFSQCCSTVTKIATFANFMYQAGFFFFLLSAILPQCCWRLPHNLFLLSSDKCPRWGEREHMGAVVD